MSEYYKPGSDFSRYRARWDFLRALSGSPAVAALWNTYERHRDAFLDPCLYLGESTPGSQFLLPMPRDLGLKTWAQKFHLEADWILDAAFNTLSYWHCCEWDEATCGKQEHAECEHKRLEDENVDVIVLPNMPVSWVSDALDNPSRASGQKRMWSFEVKDTAHFHAPDFVTPSIGSWTPEIDEWEQFEDYATTIFRESLKAYRSQVEAQAERAGLEHVQKIRQFRRNCRWLALYQTNDEMSWRGAAKQVGVDRTNFKNAVKEVARRIGLPLRVGLEE